MIKYRIIRNILLVTLVVAICSPLTAQAQNGQFKIGVVDLKNVFDEYGKQKEKYAELIKETEALQKPIDDLSAKITKIKEQLDDESTNLSKEERQELQDQYEADLGEYQADFQQSQKEIDRKEKRIFQEIIGDIQNAVEEVGAKENYHLVFDGGKNKNNSLLYFSTTLNMTQKVIDHLNKK